MIYDIEKRAFILKKNQERKHYVLVQRSSRSKFKNQAAPSVHNIKSIVKRFEETCSLDPRPRRKKKRQLLEYKRPKIPLKRLKIPLKRPFAKSQILH